MGIESINATVAAAAEQLEIVPSLMKEAEAERHTACDNLQQAVWHLRQAYTLTTAAGPACNKLLDTLTTSELCVQTAQGLFEVVTADEVAPPAIHGLQEGCATLHSDFSRASSGLLWDAGLPTHTLRTLGSLIKIYEDNFLPSLADSQTPITTIGKLAAELHHTALQHLKSEA